MVKYPPNLKPAGFLRRSLKPAYKRGFQRGVPFGSAGQRGGYRGRKNPALNGVFSPPNRGDF